jgi:hypothetical protein
MPNLTVEEALRRVEDRAVMIRFFDDSIRQVDVVPEPAFFSGLADTPLGAKSQTTGGHVANSSSERTGPCPDLRNFVAQDGTIASKL